MGRGLFFAAREVRGAFLHAAKEARSLSKLYVKHCETTVADVYKSRFVLYSKSMKKFAAFLVKHRLVILGVILLLAVASTFAMFYVNVNSDILSYLPEGMDMTEGLDFMQETFGMQGDAIVGIRGDGLTYDRMKEFADDFASRPGLKAVIWYGTIAEMANADISIPSIAQGLLDKYGITEESLAEILQQIATNPEVEDMFCPEENTYLLMLQLSVPSSSDEAMDLLEYIETSVQDAGFDVALGGSSQVTREVFMSTIGEIGKYIVVAVLVMFVILLLTSTSLVEPIIFMVTLGVSILINMGTNIILPSVSVVTFAASSVLQLALSMDYAIFLMHQYEAEKRTALDNRLAMERAIPKTFSTIAASALTTVGGFLALFFMKFEIGADLGIVLAKGVALSLLTVIFLQPSLMLILDKAREKTTHRLFLPTFKKSSGFAVTYRKTIVAIALLLLIPVAVLQGRVDLSYIKFTDEDPNPSEVEQVVDTMSNSVIVIVPVEKDEETGYAAQYGFVEDIKNMDHDVTAVMGLFTMLPESGTSLVDLMSDPMIESLLNMPGVGDAFGGSLSMITGFLNDGYTMYTIMIDCDAESDEASAALTDIRTILGQYFGDDYYITGMSQAVSDLQEITPTDFNIVTIVSVAIILVVLLFTLRSVKMSAIIIAVIEFGIFINLTLCYIVGQEINFMAYIILSSIQLGATVDYAILFTVKFKNYLATLPAKQAAYKGLTESGVSILTSVAILAGCCISVSLVTSNRIVGEITMLIARGAIISGILVLILLPALLVMFSGSQKLKKQRIRKRQKLLLRKEYKDPEEKDPTPKEETV